MHIRKIKNIYDRYGLLGVLLLLKDLIITKVIYGNWKARIIRGGARIRGRSKIIVKERFSAGYRLRMDAFGDNIEQIIIGSDVQVGDDVHIASIKKISIGNNVLMASKIYITDHNHGDYGSENQNAPFEIVGSRALSQRDVSIGNNVWLGELVSILPGVEIGDNVIIGCNSVVTKNIPSNCIAAGNPAVLIKKWNYNSKKWVRVNK